MATSTKSCSRDVERDFKTVSRVIYEPSRASVEWLALNRLHKHIQKLETQLNVLKNQQKEKL